MSTTDASQLQELLLQRLLLALRARGARRIDRIDTHISSLILADDFAYKIKKPLNLGFLDYSTLSKRRNACEEEVRLNQRYAPRLYLGAVPITTGETGAPMFGGVPALAVEWAVKMHRFDPRSLLSHHPERLSRGLVEKIAGMIAVFHHNAAVCPADTLYGSTAVVDAAMTQNFVQIRAHHEGDRAALVTLANWTEQHSNDLWPEIEARLAQGAVRECHGDLHLGNIALIDGEPVLFDGIEFNPDLRWIDRFSDLAFLSMDLTRIGRVDLAHYLVNAYLQHSGDFAGLPLLRLYEVYRAMVRAKVAAIRLSQGHLSANERGVQNVEFHRLLRTAEAFTRPGPRAVIITHGVAGSGKSTLTGSLLARLPAIRVRSDVERKRIACIDPGALGRGEFRERLYSKEMNVRTYDRLAELTRTIVEAGFIAVIDATFLQHAERQRFAHLADSLDVPFVLLSCEVDTASLKRRVAERLARGEDPSDADLDVLEYQLETQEPLDSEERSHAIVLRPGEVLEMDDVVGHILRAC